MFSLASFVVGFWIRRVFLFVLLQVQVAQGAVHCQAFNQSLHPPVGHSCHAQVEHQQAPVHRQHVGDMDHPVPLRAAEPRVTFICHITAAVRWSGAVTSWPLSGDRLMSKEWRVWLDDNALENVTML